MAQNSNDRRIPGTEPSRNAIQVKIQDSNVRKAEVITLYGGRGLRKLPSLKNSLVKNISSIQLVSGHDADTYLTVADEYGFTGQIRGSNPQKLPQDYTEVDKYYYNIWQPATEDEVLDDELRDMLSGMNTNKPVVILAKAANGSMIITTMPSKEVDSSFQVTLTASTISSIEIVDLLQPFSGFSIDVHGEGAGTSPIRTQLDWAERPRISWPAQSGVSTIVLKNPNFVKVDGGRRKLERNYTLNKTTTVTLARWENNQKVFSREFPVQQDAIERELTEWTGDELDYDELINEISVPKDSECVAVLRSGGKKGTLIARAEGYGDEKACVARFEKSVSLQDTIGVLSARSHSKANAALAASQVENGAAKEEQGPVEYDSDGPITGPLD